VDRELPHAPAESDEQLAVTVVHVCKDIADGHLIGPDRPGFAADVVNEEERIWAFEASVDNLGDGFLEQRALLKRQPLALRNLGPSHHARAPGSYCALSYLLILYAVQSEVHTR
jgi:hypothetical protein